MLGQYIFFSRKSIRLLSSETTGYPLAGGAGAVVAVVLSHLPRALAAGRDSTVLAERASAAVSPAKGTDCQPVDVIQLLAGFGGAFLNTDFGQKKEGRWCFRVGERKNYCGPFRGEDINHRQRNTPVLVKEA